MSRRVVRVAALALPIAIIAIASAAHAQQRARLAYQGGNTMSPTPQPQATEQLPPGHMSGGMSSSMGSYSGEYVGGYPAYGGGSSGCCEGEYCADSCYGCDDGCCNSCGGYGCDGSCWSRGGLGCDMLGWVCTPGHYYITADYLYARANFSSAISFLDEQDQDNQGVGSDTFHSLDFVYESSYRVGGGYRTSNCGEEVRFMFTRLSSTANDAAPPGSVVPYAVVAEPGGETQIHADVDVKAFDLDFAKTIQLGGGSNCGCGDPCGGYGCADACGCGCPAWDITWNGGLRFADVGWNRTYNALTDELDTTADAVSVMDFRGGGVKVGLEGRRYFCGNGCFSVYMKGDLSLLLGDVDHTAIVRTFDDGEQTSRITQTFSSREIIPVTEIETGMTAHITCNSSFSTGYLFSGWHDLGFRDKFQFDPLTNTEYDDANILGFDGFYARLELAY